MYLKNNQIFIHMKKTLLVCAVLVSALFSMPINAQENNTEKDIYTHSWRDNWYIQLGAGAQMPLFEKDPGESNFDIDKTTALYEAAVGHWFSPYFGFRFRGQGGALHLINGGWNKMKYLNVNIDLTWDMLNSLGGVNDKRVFSIIPYLGIGTGYAWDYRFTNPSNSNILDDNNNPMEHNWTLAGAFGIEFRFRVHKNVDLYIDARGTGLGDTFNNVAWKTGVDPLFTLSGGIKINLGKEGRHVTKYVPYDCSGEIDALNKQINQLHNDLADKDARLKAAEAQLPCPEVTEKVVENKEVITPSVRFNFNSTRISDEGHTTIYNMSKFLKANTDTKVIVKGYADKKTGSEVYNQKLSERRAQAVADKLVAYGVEEDRITVQGLGVSEQPYEDNNKWNRVVIFEVK